MLKGLKLLFFFGRLGHAEYQLYGYCPLISHDHVPVDTNLSLSLTGSSVTLLMCNYRAQESNYDLLEDKHTQKRKN